jgi:hypothetical protein
MDRKTKTTPPQTAKASAFDDICLGRYRTSGLCFRPCCLRRFSGYRAAWEADKRTQAVAVSFSREGSSAIPGPIVVESVIVLMYLPFAADGFARMISSTTAW